MNTRTLTVALVFSVLIVAGLAGLFFFVLGDYGSPSDLYPDVSTVGEPPKRDTLPEASRVEPPRTVTPIDKGPSQKETLTVHVVREDTGSAVRGSRVFVMQAADGGAGTGNLVYPTSKSRSPGSTSGRFTVPLYAGTYVVQAQAPGYKTASQKIQVTAGESKTIQLRLSTGLSISGIVRNSENEPIGGALVRAYKEIGAPDDDPITRMLGLIDIKERSREIPPEAISKPDGTYQIDGLESVYYEVAATASGYSPRARRNIRPSAQNVNFRLPPGSVFSGVVIDGATGSTVAGATVRVYPEIESQSIIDVVQVKARPPLAEAVTDGGGNFEINSLGAGLYNVVIRSDSYQEGRFQKEVIQPGENPPKTFRLDAGRVLAGDVVDSAGQPIPGARVRPIEAAQAGQRQNIYIDFDDGSVLTDENGQFAFKNLSDNKYSLLVSHNDFASKQVRDVQVGSTSLRVALASGGAIRGRVVRGDTQAPIVGARVVVTDLMDVKKEGISDANGEFYVGGLNSKRGRRSVSVEADGYARVSNQSVNVQEGSVSEQDFEMLPVARVVGRVVSSNGEPVVNARVTAKRPPPNTASSYLVPVGAGQTDDAGRFAIELEAGEETTVAVSGVSSANYLEIRSEPFAVSPAEEVALEDLVLQLGGVVQGVVVNASGIGVEGVQVSIREAGETDFSYVKTDETDSRGRFDLRGLTAGVVDLRAKSARHVDAIVEGIDVREGQITPDVRIVLEQGHQLRGRVVDPAGVPVQGARVVAREYVEGVKEHRHQTDGQGTFAFVSLQTDDTVELEVTHPDFGTYSNTRVPVGEEATITLERLGGISGVVVDMAGNPVTAFSVQPKSTSRLRSTSDQLGPRTFNSPEGRFEYPGIPAGEYTVSVSGMGYAAYTIPSVDVINGQMVDVGSIALEEGGIIDGVVVDARNGLPVAGATVTVLGGSSRFNRAADGSSGGSGKVVTDATGRFEFRNLRDGKTITLRVEHGDFVRTDVTGIDTRDAAACRDIQVELELGAELNVFVVDVNGAPQSGADIYVAGRGALKGRPGISRTGKSDQQGRHRFVGLTPGTYRVTSTQRIGAERRKATLDLDLASESRVEVELVVE